MTPVLLSLGANLGDRFTSFLHALAALEQCSGVTIRDVSNVYENKAHGFTDQPDFLNCCILIDCAFSIEDLLVLNREIETEIGRIRRQRWHERELDIDIVLAGTEHIVSASLVVPHPHMQERRFVLQPASEIAPLMVHPLFQCSVEELLERCTDNAVLNVFPRSIKEEWQHSRSNATSISHFVVSS